MDTRALDGYDETQLPYYSIRLGERRETQSCWRRGTPEDLCLRSMNARGDGLRHVMNAYRVSPLRGVGARSRAGAPDLCFDTCVYVCVVLRFVHSYLSDLHCRWFFWF